MNDTDEPVRSSIAQEDLTVSFRSMASDINLRVSGPTPSAQADLARAQQVFERVAATCTRFDPTSSLMRANAAGDGWSVVEPECYLAIEEAFSAYKRTHGAFDPRVLTALVDSGYAESFDSGQQTRDASAAGTFTLPVNATALQPSSSSPITQGDGDRGSVPAPWQPEFNPGQSAVRIGPDPIDLGGIGKGLAVRWAASELQDAGSAVLVEAGGDCYLGGPGPEGQGWRIAVEDPFGESVPQAVLQLSDLACATSSIRIRRWRNAGKTVHHLIDPRTGEPGGAGLQAVTVVGPDPADSEVWSKSLFLAGADGIAELATKIGRAALWITDDRVMGFSPAMAQHIIWRR